MPLDTQSFITYHKTMREKVFIRYNNEEVDRGGWLEEFLIPNELFADFPAYEHVEMLEHLIDHLFLSTVSRRANEEEKTLFKNLMLNEEGILIYPYRIFRDDGSVGERRNAAIVIMDYISRLAQNYRFKKVQ